MDTSPSAGRTRRRRASIAGEDQSWTATKCLRLLRPIHARISNLRQLSAEAVKTAQVAKKPTFLTSGGKKRSSSDDEWDPSGTKRAKVTYAQRKRKAKRHSDPGQSSDLQATNPSKTACWAPPPGPTTPGKFLITTPLIKRIKNAQFSPCPPSAEPPAPCRQEAGPGAVTTRPGLSYLHQDIQSLKSSRTVAAQVRHEEALLQALDALFRHAAGRGVSGGASKSLVAMCLRQAPHQLRRIEEWEADEAERRGDRTTLTASEAMPEMYQQMESLGHGDVGWAPLRHMVRAHAISSVCEAIAEGIIDFSFTKLLVKVCAHWQCLDEALALLESLLLRQYPRADCQEDVPTPTRKLVEPLAYFITFCSQHGRWSSLFSTLDRLLSENRISGEWLCTNTFEPVWTALSRRLVSTGHACPWTLNFFHMAILSLARSPRDIPAPGSVGDTASTKAARTQRQAGGPRQMFVSMVGAVTAMALMSLGRGGPSNDGIYRNMLYALDGSLSKLVGWPSSRMLHYQSLLEVGICAVSSAGDGGHSGGHPPTRLPAASSNTRYARAAQVNRRLYEGAVSLICSIAQHCSRGSPLAPHQHLLTICDSMAHVSLMGRSISDVKKDGAFMLAKRTCDLRDLAFAESKLPTEDRRAGSASGGERQSSTGSVSPGGDDGPAAVTTVYSGWSWDEGISEWVIRTPAPATAAAAAAVAATAPAPRYQKPCREVIALKTRFGRFSGKASETNKRQARAARPSTPPPRVRRPVTRRVLGAETDDDYTSEDEMAGSKPAVRSASRTAATAQLRADKPRARTRRKLVRKISSWHGLGSSDDELLL